MRVSDELETRRILVFLAVAFGVAWAVGAYIYATGGLVGSPTLISGVPLSRAMILLATGYMWAPAVANVVARAATGEGRGDLYLRPHPRTGWPYWIAAWVGPAVLTLLGAALYFAVFPAHYDPTLSTLRGILDEAAAAGAPLPFGPWGLAALQVAGAVVLAPVLNSLFTFGEEFGWRAYLLPKLLPLGSRRAMVVLGVVWGVWHWPVIAMGYNYGLGYPGAPWLGMAAMVWFTFVVGTFLGWVTLREGSVWPAVVGHAAVNGIGSIGFLFARGSTNPLFGPGVTGLVVSVPWAVTALALLWRLGGERFALDGRSTDGRRGGDAE